MDGEHRGVRWFVEMERADCAAPLVTLTGCDGLFFQDEVPSASLVKVRALVETELLRRASRKTPDRQPRAA